MYKTRSLLVVTLIALIAVACGGDTDEPTVTTDESTTEEEAVATYEDNGVSFEYPESWDEFPAEATATSTGSNELWSVTFGPDKTNLVNVTAYKLNIEITEENIADVEGELDQVIQGVVEQAGGEITDGPTPGEIAGLPAYTYTWEDVEVEGEPKDSSAYFVFSGDVEYFFNCQFSDEFEGEVQSGCDQILESFEVTGSG